MENANEAEEEAIAVNMPGLDAEDLSNDEQTDDPYLRESANVLLDLIELQSDNVFSMAQQRN